MYDAITIADEILKIAKSQGKTLTPLQLMKLVYISYGWGLAILDKQLFQNRIEAWKFGPVIPDLYQATKHFGKETIPLASIDINSNVDSETESLLNGVFKQYGKHSGVYLSGLTHTSGSPWDQVYHDGVMGIEIPDSKIRDHYKGLLDARNSSSRTTN